MSERVATRSALLELRDEQHSMREGYAFLDEKCLLLAGAMLRELQRFEALWQDCARLRRAADSALCAALGRHGLESLAGYPLTCDPQAQTPGVLHTRSRAVMGVALIDASIDPVLPTVAAPWLRTPEAAACAIAHAQWLRCATQLAAASGNLSRLQHEYRRTSRRARALDGVLLPELTEAVDEMTLTLEEAERESAIQSRPRRSP